MIDHISIRVSDYAASKLFYDAVLAPLGYESLYERDGQVGYRGPENTMVWLGTNQFVTAGMHVAFRAINQESVDIAHEAGLAAGGVDNGSPGTRPNRGEQYLAFILDPDGNNIEIVHSPVRLA